MIKNNEKARIEIKENQNQRKDMLKNHYRIRRNSYRIWESINNIKTKD